MVKPLSSSTLVRLCKSTIVLTTRKTPIGVLVNTILLERGLAPSIRPSLQFRLVWIIVLAKYNEVHDGLIRYLMCVCI